MTQVEKMIRDEEGQKYKKLMAEKDAQLEAKDAHSARLIVRVVTNTMQNSGSTLEEACRTTGISAAEYLDANRFLLDKMPA